MARKKKGKGKKGQRNQAPRTLGAGGGPPTPEGVGGGPPTTEGQKAWDEACTPAPAGGGGQSGPLPQVAGLKGLEGNTTAFSGQAGTIMMAVFPVRSPPTDVLSVQFGKLGLSATQLKQPAGRQKLYTAVARSIADAVGPGLPAAVVLSQLHAGLDPELDKVLKGKGDDARREAKVRSVFKEFASGEFPSRLAEPDRVWARPELHCSHPTCRKTAAADGGKLKKCPCKTVSYCSKKVRARLALRACTHSQDRTQKTDTC